MEQPRSYTFVVRGHLPPKKGTDLSLFGKPGEAAKAIALRLAASEAFCGDPPLRAGIRLSVVVHVGRWNDRTTGDLDNFVSGICDALMAAPSNAGVDARFDNPALSHIHPRSAVGILDDCEVLAISATKVVGDTDRPWYEVSLQGE